MIIRIEDSNVDFSARGVESLLGLTEGSILFVGLNGEIVEDNGNLFYDDENNRLGVGTNTPSETLEVDGNIAHTEDNQITYYGGSKNASVTHDGNNLIINPKVVGDGFVLLDSDSKVCFDDNTTGVYAQSESYLDLFAAGAVRIGNSRNGAPTTYVEYLSNGRVKYIGPASGTHRGSLYIHEGAQNVDISTVGQGVYVKVTGLTTGFLNGVSVNSDAFNVSAVGVYKVFWQISGDSQGNNKDYEVDIFVNGVEQDDGSARREFGASGSLGSMSGQGHIDVTNVGHDIDIRVKEVGAGVGTDFDIFNMNFNIEQLGGT
jgi:hypothetical protein